MYEPLTNNTKPESHPRQSLTLSSSPSLFFQPKLTVNTPGDAYEREADAVADQVMRMPTFAPSEGKKADAPIVHRMALSPVINVQRQCAACAVEDQEGLQRKENTGGDAGGQAAPPIVGDVLSSGGGQAMDGGTRQFMESRFGQDFGQVRIHTDSRAAESTAAIQARAYTSGRDIVFGQGEYQPGTESGKRLLAHELAHVGQQEHSGQKIQRDERESPVFSLHYRLRFGGGRGSRRHDIYAGGPDIPLLGHPALGLRIEGGRVEPIAGRNPMEPDAEMYSLGDARRLLSGQGNTATQATCPPSRISPVGCCPSGQYWNRASFRCEAYALPTALLPPLLQQGQSQFRLPSSPSLQLPHWNGFHLIDPSLLQLNLNAAPPVVTTSSDAGLTFIGGFEGLELQRYNDAAGHCTIGYGHLVHRGSCTDADYPDGITQVQALELLRADAATAVTAVNRLVTVPLNQTQFDALVSFVFNLGEGSFSRSTLLTRINEGADSEQIRAEFLRWNRAGGRELRGLTRRRAAEADLFIDGTY